MPRRWETSIGWSLVLGLCLVLGLSSPAQTPSGYSPVAPPAALNKALALNLKAVQDWVKEKDFQSAAESVHGLATLAHLYAYQSPDADWRKRCSAFQESVTRLANVTRQKQVAECEKTIAECSRLLDELAKAAPKTEAKAEAKDYKPQGSTKTWMLLMDGAYIDAKSAKTAPDLQILAQAVAEEANAAAYLRPDARWRNDSFAVREAALQVAKQAAGGNLAEAKKSLKGIYNSCEACHDRARKK